MIDEQQDPTEREHAAEEDLEMDAEQADEVKGGMTPITTSLQQKISPIQSPISAPQDPTLKLDQTSFNFKQQ